MPEQRNPYKGSPKRPWIRLVLVAADGTSRDLEVVADTGNPCAVIVSAELMRQFNQGVAPGISTNFGSLDGGWLRLRISEIGFDRIVLGYGGDPVVQAVQSSHPDFEGLAGLPLLRMMEYGGDADDFWIRPQ